jgi:MFS family permease
MSLRTILTLENFLVVMLVIFGLQLVDRSFGPVLPLHLAQLGYREDQVPLVAGVLFSVLALAGASGNQLAARLLKNESPRRLIASAVLVGAAGLVAFSYTATVALMAISIGVVGIAIGASMTTAYAAAGAVIPREVHTTAFGVLTSASLTGLAVSPVLSGLVAARSIRVVFVAGIGALVVLAMTVHRLMVERRVNPEPEPEHEPRTENLEE